MKSLTIVKAPSRGADYFLARLSQDTRFWDSRKGFRAPMENAVSVMPLLSGDIHGDRLELRAEGPWTAGHAGELEPLVERAARDAARARNLTINMGAVNAFDTFGAWLIEKLLRTAPAQQDAAIVGLRPEYQGLLQRIHKVN